MNEVYDQQPSVDADSHGFDAQLILDTFDLPAFALNENGVVIAWDDQIANLLDAPKSQVIGKEGLGAQLYGSNQRNLTLAEKVVKAPKNAHREYGVDLANEEYALLSGDIVYEDTSTIKGTEIWFICVPVFRDDEFVGVIEIVQDITSSARYQEELRQLFTELIDTIVQYEAGNFSARVEFDQEDSLLEDDFLRIVANLNEMGESIGNLVQEVRQDSQQLQESSDDVAHNSQKINDITTSQANSMETISSEVANLSATVEEIASTTDSVVQTSDRAAELAEAGDEAANDVIGVM